MNQLQHTLPTKGKPPHDTTRILRFIHTLSFPTVLFLPQSYSFLCQLMPITPGRAVEGGIVSAVVVWIPFMSPGDVAAGPLPKWVWCRIWRRWLQVHLAQSRSVFWLRTRYKKRSTWLRFIHRTTTKSSTPHRHITSTYRSSTKPHQDLS